MTVLVPSIPIGYVAIQVLLFAFKEFIISVKFFLGFKCSVSSQVFFVVGWMEESDKYILYLMLNFSFYCRQGIFSAL